jgi:Ca2+-binding EF-hand superfamily protein
MLVLFHLWDKNNDGYLSREELKELVRSISKGSLAISSVMATAFGRQPITGDSGRNGSSNYDDDDHELEFFLDQAFMQLDHDNDGRVSAGEWLTFAKGSHDIESFLNALQYKPL